MPLVKEYGTAVIALTIDEQGQTRTTEGKAAIASRLTFPIATGQEETPGERLARRIIDDQGKGLEEDLDPALRGHDPALHHQRPAARRLES